MRLPAADAVRAMWQLLVSRWLGGAGARGARPYYPSRPPAPPRTCSPAGHGGLSVTPQIAMLRTGHASNARNVISERHLSSPRAHARAERRLSLLHQALVSACECERGLVTPVSRIDARRRNFVTAASNARTFAPSHAARSWPTGHRDLATTYLCCAMYCHIAK